jgi:ribonuclease HI
MGFMLGMGRNKPMLIAKFDGACEPFNPGGHAACAALIERDGVEVHRESQYLGFGAGMTNNVAEFKGLMLILRWFEKLEPKEPMVIIGDSLIVIRRLTGKAKHPPVGVCAPLAQDCVLAAYRWRNLLTYEWQPREANEECDAMCALEIDEKMLEHQVANEEQAADEKSFSD